MRKPTKKRSTARVATDEEIVFNLKSQEYYTLGEVQAVWRILHGIWGSTLMMCDNENRLLTGLFDALTAYDDAVRERMRKAGMVK